LWSVDPRDWEFREAELVRDNILRTVRDGSVVLLHDIRESTIHGTIMAIDILLERGYTFVTIEQMYAWSPSFDLLPGSFHRSIYADYRAEYLRNRHNAQ